MTSRDQNRRPIIGPPLTVVETRERRNTAARAEREHPQWLVMWSRYFREYWACPRFRAPRGTILHSSDPAVLAADMRAVQVGSSKTRPVTVTYSPRL